MELLQNEEYKKEEMKKMLKAIQAGENVEELKKKFKDLLQSISPLEIPVVEQELVMEGVTPAEIAAMCDIHVEIFRESVTGAGKFDKLPSGHPLKTLSDENKEIIKITEVLKLYARSLANAPDDKTKQNLIQSIKNILKDLSDIRKHYEREEMLIFPYLERRGITSVPTVLWTKHDEIRYAIRVLSKLFERADTVSNFVSRVQKRVDELIEALVDMTFREDNILYPTLSFLLSEGEWVAIKEQEPDIGYFKVTPGDEWKPSAKPLHVYEVDPKIPVEKMLSIPDEVKTAIMNQESLMPDDYELVREGDIDLGTGFLSVKELIEIFKILPVDISFIDKDDRVRFFSNGPHRIFGRSPSILGRKVHQCHPPKSVHIVDKILKGFKSGERKKAEFWIQFMGRFIYIKYLPIFDNENNYIGTIEITQDITDLRKLEGQKRLLDWK